MDPSSIASLNAAKTINLFLNIYLKLVVDGAVHRPFGGETIAARTVTALD